MSMNPMSSPSMGAIGDLGLSSSAMQDAAAIADKARRKKQMDDKDLANAGSGGMPSAAFQALTGMGTV